VIWTLVPTEAARSDLEGILARSADTFGPDQATVYRATINAALSEIAADPYSPLAPQRDDIAPGVRMMPCARHGRPASHAIAYRIDDDARTVLILRLLHERMDAARQLDAPDGRTD
jgi:plasmid stabilization system protein ParE